MFGVFGSAFCDFGNSFEVMDPTGEEGKEVFIANITKVRCLLSLLIYLFLYRRAQPLYRTCANVDMSLPMARSTSLLVHRILF